MGYTFKVNGVDFSDLVNQKGYFTDSVPVVSWTSADLYDVRNEVVSRRRGSLSVKLKPLREQRAHDLFVELSRPVLNVTYTSNQTGEVLTQRMKATGFPLRHLVTAFSDEGETTYLDGATLSFEEL